MRTGENESSENKFQEHKVNICLITRCAAPNKSQDYQKIYADWCHEFEKYKSAMKTWEKRQSVSKISII